MAYPRVFRRRFKCAYHDRRFYLTFRFSNLSRRWKVEAAEKIESTAVTEYDEDGASDIPAGRDVPLSAIDQRSFFCPWCEIGCIKDSPLVGGKNYWAAIVHCDRCDELVCLGNSDDEKFTCGKSCGHSGMPVNKKIILKTEEQTSEAKVSASSDQSSGLSSSQSPPAEALEAPRKKGLLSGAIRRLKG